MASTPKFAAKFVQAAHISDDDVWVVPLTNTVWQVPTHAPLQVEHGAAGLRVTGVVMSPDGKIFGEHALQGAQSTKRQHFTGRVQLGEQSFSAVTAKQSFLTSSGQLVDLDVLLLA